MTIYLIDGKPHRLCDCDEHTELCPRGVKRALQTCGFSRCFVPVPDAIYTVSGDEQTDTEYQNTYSVDDHRQALAGKQTPEWATKGTQYPAPNQSAATRKNGQLCNAKGTPEAPESRPAPAAAPIIPEGCTPADAAILRQANHDLAIESWRRGELLREWLETELDAQDEEYQPWLDSFTERVKAALPPAPDAGGQESAADKLNAIISDGNTLDCKPPFSFNSDGVLNAADPAMPGLEILASHSGKSQNREWHSVGTWLYPGEAIYEGTPK